MKHDKTVKIPFDYLNYLKITPTHVYISIKQSAPVDVKTNRVTDDRTKVWSVDDNKNDKL